MTCSAVREIVAAYVDGDLGPTELNQINAHLASCHACLQAVDENKEVRNLVRTRRVDAPMPDGLWMKVMAALDRHTRVRYRLRRFAMGAAALATMAALATITVDTVFNRPIEVVASQAAPVTFRTVYSAPIRNTAQAYARVREHLQANVPPVNLALVGGTLRNIELAEEPKMGILTYQLRGSLLRYYISKQPFHLPAAVRWEIMGKSIWVLSGATGLLATWSGKGLNYLVVTDHQVPEPKGLLREFLSITAGQD
jgi:mycothiol system anti-sigma-R factor